MRPCGERRPRRDPCGAKRSRGGGRQERRGAGHHAGRLGGEARGKRAGHGAQRLRHGPQKRRHGAGDDGHREHAALHLVVGEQAEPQAHEEDGKRRRDRKRQERGGLPCGIAHHEARDEDGDERPCERGGELPSRCLRGGDARLGEGRGDAPLELLGHDVEQADRARVRGRDGDGDGHEERLRPRVPEPVRPDDRREHEGEQRAGRQHREHDGVARSVERVVRRHRRYVPHRVLSHSPTMIPDGSPCAGGRAARI